jgi:predicted phosphodiesterase
MKLAVFSDLHLAAGRANRCTASPRQLLDLFDRLEAAADRVVVCGDLFALDRPRRPGRWREHLGRVRDEFAEVLRRLDDYEWIWGNHDAALRRLQVPEERTWATDGLHILATHGHQFDPALKKLPGLAPTANFVAGWLERTGLDPVAGWMAKVPHRLDQAWGRSADGDRSLDGAARLLADGAADIVVMGHSHRLRLVPCLEGLFVNTGSLSNGFVDWVLIDTEAAQVRAMRDGEVVQRAAFDGERWTVEGSPPDKC